MYSVHINIILKRREKKKPNLVDRTNISSKNNRTTLSNKIVDVEILPRGESLIKTPILLNGYQKGAEERPTEVNEGRRNPQNAVEHRKRLLSEEVHFRRYVSGILSVFFLVFILLIRCFDTVPYLGQYPLPIHISTYDTHGIRFTHNLVYVNLLL